MTTTIILLGGGISPERDVSLRSMQAVKIALQAAGYNTLILDPADGLGELTKYDPAKYLVFPILHGQGGEDGTVQAVLEAAGFRYLGSGPKASAKAFDKGLARREFQRLGLPIADGEVVSRESYRKSQFKKFPHVLKACNGGSSIGTYICRTPETANSEAIDQVFKLCERAVIERLVEGTELTVGILGNEALPLIEIIPPEHAEFDYVNKYNGQTQELCPPVSIREDQQRELQKLALQAHRALGCRHISRVDMMLGADGPVILEINTMPGMTDQSLYPKAARQAGLEFSALAAKLVTMVEKSN